MPLLEKLDGELDIDQPAGSELEVEVGVLAGWDALSLDPGLNRPNRPNTLGRQLLGPDPGTGRGEEAGGQDLVSGHWARSDERLELPRLRPALP